MKTFFTVNHRREIATDILEAAKKKSEILMIFNVLG